jgi:hypothetical protein
MRFIEDGFVLSRVMSRAKTDLACFHSTCFHSAPPKFSKSDMKDTLTLNAGASSAIEFPFTANPQPKVTWTYNDGSLPDAKRFKTQTITCMTSMTMAKVILKDAGDYKVTLENENGQATFTTKLIVLGKRELTLNNEDY